MKALPSAARDEAMLNAIRAGLESVRDFVELLCRGISPELGAEVQVPPWVRICADELGKTLYAPVHSAMSDFEATPHRLGYALGFMKWGAEGIEKPVPRPLRRLKWKGVSTRAKRKAGKMVEAFLLEHGLTRPDDFGRSHFIPPNRKRVEKHIERLRGMDAAEFHRGMSEGMRGVGEGAPGNKSNDAVHIYVPMVLFWRRVERMETLTEFHRWLTAALGQNRAGSLERAKTICRKLGKKFKGRGRPKKNRVPLLLPSHI